MEKQHQSNGLKIDTPTPHSKTYQCKEHSVCWTDWRHSDPEHEFDPMWGQQVKVWVTPALEVITL